MNMKDYQDEAVEKLLNDAKELLRASGDKKMLFKSPTGSGKTIMMAKFLGELVQDNSLQPLSVIWTAPRHLHTQSYEKLKGYYEDLRLMECVYFDNLTNRQIGEEEILFLNWESIRQENKNIIVKENERDLYLSKILENTKGEGRAILLVIDESHYHATSAVSKKLIDNISPKLTVEVSATPSLQDYDKVVSVLLDKVKLEGMIKKSVILNEGFKNTLTDDGITPAFDGRDDEFVLEQALAKRKKLADAFNVLGANINPLLCIQLPDSRTEQDDNIRNSVVEKLRENSITIENGKFAIWLSDEKENLDNISQNDNTVEVLMFKQAIALGWDCPRAHILVLFRNWQSINFSVQTLGRIMRMPEPEVGHYANQILNGGYVYTNMPRVDISEDVSDGYVSIYDTCRINTYMPITLQSAHRLRQREKTRLAPSFGDSFLLAAKECDLNGKIKYKNQTVQNSYIADYKKSNIDEIGSIEGGVNINVENEVNLQKLFDYFARDNLSPYTVQDRSINNIKNAIYDFFGGPLEIGENFHKIHNIVLSEDNRQHFVHVLDKAKTIYSKKVAERVVPLQINKQWELPEIIKLGDKYLEYKVVKSAMQPFYAANNQSTLEKKFINLLENTESVKWWYKNGEGDSLYFAIPYTENGEEKLFYVDFIVEFNDNTIGLYDTKSGMTITTAKEKSDGLLAYIKEANKKRKYKLHGGIVTLDNQIWKIYRGKGEDLNRDDLSNWEYLEI